MKSDMTCSVTRYMIYLCFKIFFFPNIKGRIPFESLKQMIPYFSIKQIQLNDPSKILYNFKTISLIISLVIIEYSSKRYPIIDKILILSDVISLFIGILLLSKYFNNLSFNHIWPLWTIDILWFSPEKYNGCASFIVLLPLVGYLVCPIPNEELYDNAYDIAVIEYNEKKIPFIIKRTIGNKNEYWKLNDLL